jgi:hypothetical protein
MGFGGTNKAGKLKFPIASVVVLRARDVIMRNDVIASECALP